MQSTTKLGMPNYDNNPCIHGGGTGLKEAMIPTAPGIWFPISHLPNGPSATIFLNDRRS